MPARHWAFIFVTLGLGHGFVLASLNFAIQALAVKSSEDTAAGMYTFSRSLGMCIGVACAGTFFQNRLRSHLESQNLNPSVANSAPEFALQLRKSNWSQVEKQNYITCFTDSFKDLWLFFMAVSALALVLSLFIQHETLDRKLDSDHTLMTRESDTKEGGDSSLRDA